MPPAEGDHQGETTDVSGAESIATGATSVQRTSTTGVRSTGTTAIEDFTDKYFNLKFLRLPQEAPNEFINRIAPLDPGSKVVGSLKRHIEFWERNGASDFILSTIRDGYKIPFFETPHSAYFRNNKSSLNHKDFVSEEIENLLRTGRIKQVFEPPTVVNPLTVAVNGAKPRLILDLRYVNTHLWSQGIKYEDFRTLRSYLTEGAYMFSFDFKSGYHHIEIMEEHRQYLGFSWTTDGVTRFYVFIVLPFGLASAGYIFTKVCRVLVKFWRSNGIKIVLYLDDGIGVADSLGKGREISQFVRSSIEDSGFIVNEEKSTWDPVQQLVWLGLVIRTHPFTLSITQKRMDKLFARIDSLSQQTKASARQISAVTGSIDSQKIVLGNITSLFTRNMNRFVARAVSWDSVSMIPGIVRKELRFWKKNATDLNVRWLQKSPKPPLKLKIVANSDASDFASGSIVKINNTSHTAHKNLSMFEASLSSTWRELDAIRFSLSSFASILRNKLVVWATDNDPAVRIISKGSRKPHLHSLAVDIYYICRENRIDLHTVWVPREFNQDADTLSKTIDYDDWTTTWPFFHFIDSLWGPCTIDRFANEKNAKTPRFNSKHWNPGSEAVDAFAQDWGKETNWLVPPIHLIPQVILHAERCAAAGILLVPAWRSAPFWPLLFADDGRPKPWILDTITYQDPTGILELGDYKRSLLGSPRFKSPLTLIRFNFQQPTGSKH